MTVLDTQKYWLQAENDRNTHHGLVFIDLIKRAFGADQVVMVGHHFTFEAKPAMLALDLSQQNEIPSADTLIFDHDIMRAVFGERAQEIMIECAQTRCEARDAIIARELAKLPPATEPAHLHPATQPTADAGLPLDGDE